MKKYINKKIIIALLLLLPGQQHAGATTMQKGARFFGGTAAVGGALLAGKTAYDFYNAFKRAKEKVITSDPTFEITDLDSFKRVAAVARKDKHFGEKRFWAGCGLLAFGSGVGMFTQHQITTDAAHVKRVAAETLKKHEARFETIKGSLAELNAAYKKVSFKDNLPKLQAIQDQLAKDLADKTELKPADIDFLKTYNNDLYDALIQDITHHNNQVTNRIKCAEIDKWNAFLATNQDKAIFKAIGLDEDFFKGSGKALAHDKISAYDAWKAKNETILNFLKANGFDQLVAAEAATKPLQFIKVENGDQFENGSKNIYEAFVDKIKENNVEFLRQKISTEIAAATQKAAVDPCESNPFKSWTEIRHQFLTAEQRKTEATDFDPTQLNELRDRYENFLVERASQKLNKLDAWPDFIIGDALGITAHNIEQNAHQILEWTYLPKQQTTAPIKAGTAQASRQLYDILNEVQQELNKNGIDVKAQYNILSQINNWYTKGTPSFNITMNETMFIQVHELLKYLDYHQNSTYQSIVTLIQEKLSCLPSGNQRLILEQAFSKLQQKCFGFDGTTQISGCQLLDIMINQMAPFDLDAPQKTPIVSTIVFQRKAESKSFGALVWDGVVEMAIGKSFTYDKHEWHWNPRATKSPKDKSKPVPFGTGHN